MHNKGKHVKSVEYIRQQFRSLYRFANGPDEQVIGGLFYDISWDQFHIDILRVDEALAK